MILTFLEVLFPVLCFPASRLQFSQAPPLSPPPPLVNPDEDVQLD